MDSSLLNEINEDLQRQRLGALWKRFGVYVVGGAVALVLGTAAYNGWHYVHVRDAQESSGALYRILSDAGMDDAQRASALDSFATNHPGDPQAALARLNAARAYLDDDKTDQAVAAYDAVAGDSSVDPVLRQLATLLAVQTNMDRGEPGPLVAQLEPLLGKGPWQLLAKEYTAHLALKVGDKAKARRLFQELTNEAAEKAPTIVGRATDMLRWMDAVP